MKKLGRIKVQSLVATLFLLLCPWLSSAAADQDPPGRVARVSYMEGSVSYRPAGETDWFEASINRPLTTGDSIWVDKGSRGELHIDSTAIRLSAETGLSILNLDDRTVQIRLFSGTIEVHLRHFLYGDAFEVDTPNLALTIGAGEFRIEADPSGGSTSIAVHRGMAEVTAGGEAYNLNSPELYTFTGTDSLTSATTSSPGPDDFEDWCQSREQRENDSPSASNVSRDIDGYYDLDDSGDWQSDPDYGPIWFPRGVAPGWAPYHFGHWVFIAPWGWTWIADEKWGFTTFHYGRWAYADASWGWVPGPIVVRPIYAPALVAFVHRRGFGSSAASASGAPGVAWFPLAPRDVYVPSYPSSLRYAQTLNVTNTKFVGGDAVAVLYNSGLDHRTAQLTYANRRAPGAVTAVSRDTFVQAKPVAVATLRLEPQELRSAPVTASAAVAPTRSSYLSAEAKLATGKPAPSVVDKPAVARLTPPTPERHMVYTNDSAPFNQQRHAPAVSAARLASGEQTPSPRNDALGSAENPGRAPASGAAMAAQPNRVPVAAPENPRQTSAVEHPPAAVRFTPPIKAREEMYDVHPSAPAPVASGSRTPATSAPAAAPRVEPTRR